MRVQRHISTAKRVSPAYDALEPRGCPAPGFFAPEPGHKNLRIRARRELVSVMPRRYTGLIPTSGSAGLPRVSQ
jgi:hypothetical protein